jgi:hypothetical protein
MYLKFCESRYNLNKGCQTISIGTLDSYNEDDPDFLKFDPNEGKIEVTNFGSEVTISREDSLIISNGGILGEMKVNEGGNIKVHFSFPNCYIFCLGYSIYPSIENAKKIDENYDSWYFIEDINRFSIKLLKLLAQQIKLSDLVLNEDVTLEYIKGITIQLIHNPVKYIDKKIHLTDESINNVKNIIKNPYDWIFKKDIKYNSLPEYRIVFVLLDEYNNIVEVKNKNKIIDLNQNVGNY